MLPNAEGLSTHDEAIVHQAIIDGAVNMANYGVELRIGFQGDLFRIRDRTEALTRSISEGVDPTILSNLGKLAALESQEVIWTRMGIDFDEIAERAHISTAQ